MYTSTTLYLTLSALVASSRVAALPSWPAVGGVFAGAPTDGSYPQDATDMEGWADDGPTYEQPAQDGYDTTVTWSTTVVQAGAHATPMHGSGSAPPTDLDSCYQVCKAQWGGGAASSAAAPSHTASTSASAAHATGTPSAASHPASSSTSAAAHVTSAGGAAHPSGPGGGAGGATHTIIVAPTQGVLRFVPFAIKAEQGDTLEYIWGGGPHSATLSNGTNVCAKSTEPNAFDSGNLNATATFTTVYDKNTTGPTFFYCKVGQHCANGMFGIINPPSSNVTNELTDKATAPRPDSTAGAGGKNAPGVDGWMTSWGLTNPDNQKKIDAVKAACKDTPGAWDWGSKWEWESMLSTSVTKETIVENTLYTRLMASYNPAMLKNEPYGADWKAAPDLTTFAADYAGGASSSGEAYGSSAATGSPLASASVSADAAAASAGSGNGAGRLGSPVSAALLAALSLIFVFA